MAAIMGSRDVVAVVAVGIEPCGQASRSSWRVTVESTWSRAEAGVGG